MYTPVSYLPRDRNWTLDELNEEQIKLLIPSIIFTSVLIVSGTVGNCLVLYVYLNKFKASNHRCFILMLAYNDIVMCLVGMPFLIVDALYAYKFTAVIACKLFRLCNYYTSCASMSTLCLIAVDRYMRICRPLSNQMSLTTAKRMLYVIAFAVAVVMSAPSYVMYGKNTINTGVNNITGVQCFTDDKVKDTLFPAIYNMSLLGIISIYGTVITFCYVNVAKERCSRMANRKKHVRLKQDVAEKTASSLSHQSSSDNGVNTIFGNGDAKGSSPRTVQFVKRKETTSARRCDWKQRKNMRIAKILFLITALFILSFVPHLILMLLIFTDEHFLEGMTAVQASVYQVALRSFILNGVVNPFVYGAMDGKFRTECKRLLLRRS